MTPFNEWPDEILQRVFIFGVGTQSDDIKGNETAYLNLQKYSVSSAKQSILTKLDSVIEELKICHYCSGLGYCEKEKEIKQQIRTQLGITTKEGE